MKKIVSAVAVLSLILCFVGCSSGKSADLYTKGLEVSTLMEEMLGNESYMNIMGAPNMVEEKVSQVSKIELSEPVDVYELSLPDASELALKSGFVDLSDWSKLSPSLKEQLENRIGFQMVANLINASQGSDTIAFCSLYTAIIRDDGILCKKPVTYLYVFDIDTAVAVTFSGYLAQGNFLFADDLYSTESLDELFKPFGIGFKSIK